MNSNYSKSPRLSALLRPARRWTELKVGMSLECVWQYIEVCAFLLLCIEISCSALWDKVVTHFSTATGVEAGAYLYGTGDLRLVWVG